MSTENISIIITKTKVRSIKKTSAVWKYFTTKKDEKFVERNFCKEHKCEKSYASGTATSALITHLFNDHGIKLVVEKFITKVAQIF